MELGWEHRTEEQTVYSFLLNLINIKRVDPRLRLTSSEIFQPSKFYVLFPHEMKKHIYHCINTDKLGILDAADIIAATIVKIESMNNTQT